MLFSFPGNLLDESNVLDWMIAQKQDLSIPEIDRDDLAELIVTKEFLAVVWCKYDLYYFSCTSYNFGGEVLPTLSSIRI